MSNLNTIPTPTIQQGEDAHQKKLTRSQRVLLLLRRLDYGGAQRQVVELARALHKRGHCVVVSVFYPDGALEAPLEEAGVAIRHLHKRGRWDILGFLVNLVRVVHEERPDVLYSYLAVPNILSVLLRPFFPRLRIVMGLRGSNNALKRTDWLASLSYWLEARLSCFADLIVANSRAGRNYAISQGFPHRKVIVIPNGIDTARFYPDSAARRRLRTEWGVHDEQFLIGMAARLDPLKDHPTFLRAAALLLAERDDVRFVCLGDGATAYRHKLEEMTEALGLRQRVLWTGEWADMHAAYNAMDIATLSSASEGFPNTVGEAMACGVPCVTADVGDAAWLVGDTGIVVPPSRPEALAAGWKSMLAADREEMGRRARQRVIDNFSVERLAEQTEQALWPKA
jgi:glycosyltransferase involved in cell wall biosynthesis